MKAAAEARVWIEQIRTRTLGPPNPEELKTLGPDADRHVACHNRIARAVRWWWRIGLVIGSLASVGVVVIASLRNAASDATVFAQAADFLVRQNGWGIAFVLPFGLGLMGAGLALLLGCGFASTDYLSGPLGSRWKQLVGSDKVATVRTVCFALSAVAGAFVGLLIFAGLAIALDWR
jgi:FtsH-binding integral membrane protein